MALLETGYRPWHGQVQNVWKRRGVVARHTMRTCLQGRVVRFLVIVPWVLALVTVIAFFGVGQILVPDGLMEPLNFYLLDGRGRAIMDGLVAWLALYPDITVRAVANFLLLFLSGFAQTFSFLIITMVIPRLLTQDVASNAIVVYSSRAISRLDYLGGKLAGLLGVLTLAWLGPVLAAWFLGNVVAPDWSFFWHARSALVHSLLLIVPAMIAVALIALGISSLSPRARIARATWLMIWILTLPLIGIAKITQPWLAYLSISHVIDRLGKAIFSPYQDFVQARGSLPFFNSVFGKLPTETIQQWGDSPMMGPVIALTIMTAIAVAILWRRIRVL